MKDNAIKWLTELNPFDKVKGHTKIELTDIHTGKKQVIEKDNAFQAGVLASYMRSMGAYNNNPYANGTWAGQPIWRNLCGGILCFEDAIDLTGGEVEYMPAGNKMIANGAYMVNNAGTPIELGSYNEVESSTSGNDSVTFVYDWLTSQGNGVISCVCLTTEIGGYIGYGNPSGARRSGKAFTTNQSSNALSGVPYKNFRYNFSVDKANLKLTVTKYPTEITKGSIFDNLPIATEYSFSEAVSGSSFLARYIGNGKIAICGYIHSNQWASTSATVFQKYLIFDVNNDTVTVATLYNNTGKALYYQYNTTQRIVLSDTLYIAHNANDWTQMLIINSSTGALVNTVPNQGSSFTNDIRAIQISNNLFILGGGESGTPYIFDVTNNTLYMTNISMQDFAYNEDSDILINNSGMYKNPLILATVNNLETPVTKTAAQTMKITYTLTKASE